LTLFIRAGMEAMMAETDKRKASLDRVCGQGALLLLGAAKAAES